MSPKTNSKDAPETKTDEKKPQGFKSDGISIRGTEHAEPKKPAVSVRRPPARQMPSLVTKDTNDIEKTALLPADGFEAKLAIGHDVFASDEFLYEQEGYSRSRTIDGSLLPQERTHRAGRRNSRKPFRSVSVSIEAADRFEPDADTGLSGEQVLKRTEEGLVNVTKRKTSKTFRSIFFANIFTPINLIAIAVAVALIIARSDIAQYMFIVIIGVNMTIGIAQEIRAKLTIEKLSILSAPSATVIRDGERRVIPVYEVVLDDIMCVEAGKQICADAIVVRGEAELNESLLTGESVPVKKMPGSELYSGSFVSSGNCLARVNKVGAANYVETLTSHAKKYKKPKSELFNSVNFIIKIVIPLSIIIATATVLVYYFTNMHAKIGIDGYDPWPDWQDNIQRAAAVMIGMLPTGMFLLTSTALVVSVVRLGNRKTLVKDLNCIEMLARADVLCLDKTGTITDGTMIVRDVVEIKGAEGMTYSFKEIVGSVLSATGDNNQTAMALANHFGYSKVLTPSVILPFSSARKLAAVSFGEAGTFLYGAPEFVLRDVGIRIDKMINEYARQGLRVLVVAHSPAQIVGDKLPAVRRPLCLVTIEDHIRADACDTIRWFKENGVAVKVISGDNPVTVSEVAKRVGIENAELYISLEKLSNREVFEAAHKYTVFGRVTPEQKMLLVKAMKQKGKTVAMTGDGVNDILAMRESDCAVAIASGAEAARNVAHLVLQDSSFTSMPQVVKEGRRVVNNIQQTSSLFLMKTFMTILLAVVSLLMRTDYPYKTSYLLLLEFFIIAGASFALALQSNTNLIKGKFLSNVIGRSAPGGITLAFATLGLLLYLDPKYFPNPDATNTMLVLCVTMVGFVILIKLCEPANLFRTIMLIAVAALLVIAIFALPGVFGITMGTMSPTDLAVLIVIIMGSYFFVSILIKIMRALKILN